MQDYRQLCALLAMHLLADGYLILDDRAKSFGVTAAGRSYFEPLIAGEAYPAYQKGMPRYTRLKKVLVPRRCKAWSD